MLNVTYEQVGHNMVATIDGEEVIYSKSQRASETERLRKMTP